MTGNDAHELRAIIALPLIDRVGNRKAKDLIRHYGSARAALENDHTLEGVHAALQRADQELDFIAKHHLSTFYYEDADYPQRLSQCPDCPLLLYGKGNLRPNDGKFVSVVGTRSPSDRGKQLCRELVMDLAKKVPDVTIVSGLAYGIDVTAHRAALEAGLPTIIIPGHGLDRIYPSTHRQVAVQALKNGGILTEYMSGTEPHGPNFVARNRIIAGMADAVIVIESALKGGSLITADLANSYNRDVFAYPGRVTDPYSQGCNYLIRTNRAHLMEGAANLRYVMRWDQNRPVIERQTALFREYTEEEQRVMECFEGQNMVSLDDIIVKTDLPTTKLASLLLNLEFDGIVMALPGKRYRRG